MSFELKPPHYTDPYISPIDYSIYEGGEVSAGYMIGSATLWPYLRKVDSPIPESKWEVFETTWTSSFKSRDPERYPDWTGSLETHQENSLNAIFAYLYNRHPGAGPFHAVRCYRSNVLQI